MVKVHWNEKGFKGLLSIGTRPTVTNSNEKRVEVFILDFKNEIYSENLKIEILEYIREDLKFDSLEELTQQMKMDKAFAKKFQF